MVDDGIRSLEDPWHYNQVLMDTLHELEISFVTIASDLKDLNDRIRFVQRHLYGMNSLIK